MSIDREHTTNRLAELDALYQRLGEGTATEADLDAARAELDGSSWATGSALRDALGDVADGVDVADAVFAELGLTLPAVGDAVRAAAGGVDVSASVLAAVGAEAAPDLRSAVFAAAGRIDVSDAVMAALDVDVLPVGSAVREAAGPVHLADAVMASLSAPRVQPVTPVTTAPVHAPAANSRRWFTLVAVAAAALLTVGVGNWLASPSTPLDGGGALAAIGFAPDEALVFASAAEVQIEDLSFGEDVVVFQDEGADGALILWVDEEVL